MLLSLNTLEWQVLRAILRHKGTGGCPGSVLRLVPSRRTKNGVHLVGLAKAGLIEAVGPPAPPEPPVAGVLDATAEPFRTRWRLTEAGRQAAEFGEYDDGSSTLALPTPAEFAAARAAEAGDKPAKPRKDKR